MRLRTNHRVLTAMAPVSKGGFSIWTIFLTTEAVVTKRSHCNLKTGLNVNTCCLLKGELHYLPFIDGKHSKLDLDIKEGNRFVALWKGRGVPFADIWAM